MCEITGCANTGAKTVYFMLLKKKIMWCKENVNDPGYDKN